MKYLRHRSRGDSRPRLSGGAEVRDLAAGKRCVELRSTGQPRAAVPTRVAVELSPLLK